MLWNVAMNQLDMGVRRFGIVNWLGLQTLIWREIMRFVAVWTQTVLAPLVTAGLFLAIFNIAIGPSRGEVLGVSFIEFLAPGILTMTVIQNAFANVSSSVLISKVQGNIVDTLMPPLSPLELVLGYVIGGWARGMVVGLGIALGLVLLLGQSIAHPLLLVVFLTLGSMLLGAIGLVAGIFANKFDQMAAITNFIVTPLAFLSGTFYSVAALPDQLQGIPWVNPIFYLIDGARFAFIGTSDSNPLVGLCVLVVTLAVILTLAWSMLKNGRRIKP